MVKVAQVVLPLEDFAVQVAVCEPAAAGAVNLICSVSVAPGATVSGLVTGVAPAPLHAIESGWLTLSWLVTATDASAGTCPTVASTVCAAGEMVIVAEEVSGSPGLVWHSPLRQTSLGSHCPSPSQGKPNLLGARRPRTAQERAKAIR